MTEEKNCSMYIMVLLIILGICFGISVGVISYSDNKITATINSFVKYDTLCKIIDTFYNNGTGAKLHNEIIIHRNLKIRHHKILKITDVSLPNFFILLSNDQFHYLSHKNDTNNNEKSSMVNTNFIVFIKNHHATFWCTDYFNNKYPNFYKKIVLLTNY
jgi:hypothetical protein